MDITELLADLSERTILISAYIGEDTALGCMRTLVTTVDKYAATSVTLLINSSGGDLAAALHLARWLEWLMLAYPVKLTGRVIEQASTAALVILSVCHQRVAYLNTRFQLKLGRVTKVKSSPDHSITILKTSETEDQVARCIAACTGWSVKRVLRMANGRKFDTRTAFRMGILTEAI